MRIIASLAAWRLLETKQRNFGRIGERLTCFFFIFREYRYYDLYYVVAYYSV
jgi:hypothetical protein